jgi:hypothetical protein
MGSIETGVTLPPNGIDQSFIILSNEAMAIRIALSVSTRIFE